MAESPVSIPQGRISESALQHIADSRKVDVLARRGELTEVRQDGEQILTVAYVKVELGHMRAAR